MSYKKKRILFLTTVIVIASLSCYLVIRSISQSRREQQIFCKGDITLDMDRNDVLAYLQSFGDVGYNVNKTGNYEEVYVWYVDKHLVSHSGYILSFFDGKYSGVSAFPNIWEFKGLGSVASVCD